jgi:hypothetical protein
MADEITVKDETETQEDGASKKGGCFRTFLVILVIVVILWFIQPVQTGVGEMSRFRVTRINLHLALVVKPAGFDPLNGACAKAYGNEIYEKLVGFALMPTVYWNTVYYWIDMKVLSDGTANPDPPDIRKIYDGIMTGHKAQMEEWFPGGEVPERGDRCHLPNVSTWTLDMLP